MRTREAALVKSKHLTMYVHLSVITNMENTEVLFMYRNVIDIRRELERIYNATE